MSGYPRMNDWERSTKAGREHIDRQLLKDHPESEELVNLYKIPLTGKVTEQLVVFDTCRISTDLWAVGLLNIENGNFITREYESFSVTVDDISAWAMQEILKMPGKITVILDWSEPVLEGLLTMSGIQVLKSRPGNTSPAFAAIERKWQELKTCN